MSQKHRLNAKKFFTKKAATVPDLLTESRAIVLNSATTSDDIPGTSSESPDTCTTTEDYTMETEDTPTPGDPSRCPNCGTRPVSREEARRIVQSEAQTYVNIIGKATVSLETRKFLADRVKCNGPEELQGPQVLLYTREDGLNIYCPEGLKSKLERINAPKKSKK